MGITPEQLRDIPNDEKQKAGINQPQEKKCHKCYYIWLPKTLNPKSCPRCKTRTDYNWRETDLNWRAKNKENMEYKEYLTRKRKLEKDKRDQGLG